MPFMSVGPCLSKRQICRGGHDPASSWACYWASFRWPHGPCCAVNTNKDTSQSKPKDDCELPLPESMHCITNLGFGHFLPTLLLY